MCTLAILELGTLGKNLANFYTFSLLFITDFWIYYKYLEILRKYWLNPLNIRSNIRNK